MCWFTTAPGSRSTCSGRWSSPSRGWCTISPSTPRCSHLTTRRRHSLKRPDFAEGLLGNLFSPSRGLFIFSPVLLLALSGFVLCAARSGAAAAQYRLRRHRRWTLDHRRRRIDVVGRPFFRAALHDRHRSISRVLHGLQFPVARHFPAARADGTCRLDRRACAGEHAHSRARCVAKRNLGMELDPQQYRPEYFPRLGLERPAIRPYRCPSRTSLRRDRFTPAVPRWPLTNGPME